MLSIIFATMLAAATADPVELRDPGPIEHRAARAVFPLAVGAFQRRRVFAYNADQTDMSATYRREGSDVSLSVFIYPASIMPPSEAGCTRHYESIAQSVVTYSPGTTRRPSSPDAYITPSVPATLTHRALFDGWKYQPTDERAFVSQLDLYCYVDGAWLVMYRTHGTDTGEMERSVADFVRTGPWPGRPAEPAPRR